nr:hypothetical protein [uncultured Undibacterium sp.]
MCTKIRFLQCLLTPLIVGLAIATSTNAQPQTRAQIEAESLNLMSIAIPKVKAVEPSTSRGADSSIRSHDMMNFVYFDQGPASSQLIELTSWITETGDNQSAPYLIIDKAHAQLLIFHSDGTLAGTTPVLLGLAVGDKLIPNTNQHTLAKIRPADRITPAGRFPMEFGHDLHGQDIFWIDYDASISLHRIFEGNVKEHRRERMQSASSADNRISFGCINVSKEFYEKTLRHVFSKSLGFAYIMPEDNSLALPYQ